MQRQTITFEWLRSLTATQLTKKYKEMLTSYRHETANIEAFEKEIRYRGYDYHIAPMQTLIAPQADMFQDTFMHAVVDANGDLDKIFDFANDVSVPGAYLVVCYVLALAVGEENLAIKISNFIKRVNTYNQFMSDFLTKCMQDQKIVNKLAALSKQAEEYRSW